MVIEDRGYTVKEAAQVLGVTRHYLYRLVKRGEIPAIRVGGWALRILGSDLRAYIESRRTGGKGDRRE